MPMPDGISLHRRDQRLGRYAEVRNKPRRVCHDAGIFRLRGEIAHVVAGREVIAVALKHNRADCRIFFRGFQRVRESGIHCVGDGIHLVRTRQCQRQDA